MDLRSYLTGQKISVETFATDLNVAAATVYRYVNGERRPRDEVMARIVRLTGGAVQPNDFYQLDAPAETEAA